MTPSFFRRIEPHWSLISLKTLILGGEPFPHPSNTTITQLIRSGKRVMNIYGLTEMSCWASYYILSEADLQCVFVFCREVSSFSIWMLMVRRTDGISLGHPLDQTCLQLEPFPDDPSKTNCFQLVLGKIDVVLR